LAGFGSEGLSEYGSLIDSNEGFVLDDFFVQPFTVPHDAREPVQFVLADDVSRFGMLTDAGHVTPHMVAMLQGCHALVLECNHDADLLAQGVYPPALKHRIGSAWGHLDNAAAAQVLSQVAHGGLRHVIAAHLSEQNNRPHLARLALASVLGCAAGAIAVASQEEGIGWRTV